MALDQDITQAPAGSPTGIEPDKPRSTTFETLAVCGFIFGLFAIVAAVFAVGLAARAVSQANGSKGSSGSSTPSGPSGPAVSEVSLGEFFIKPADANAAVDATITVKNDGTVQHDLTIKDTSNATPLLDPGKEGTLDLKGLKPGTYTWYCTVPGHEAAGMKGTITIG